MVKDLIVIGGGALGTFSAYHALEKGYSVTLLERNKTPMQATVRNFGQIVPSGLSQDWLKYGLKSLEVYKHLRKQGDFTIQKEGTYYLASDSDEQTLLEECYEINQSRGYACKLLSAKKILEKQAGIRPDYVKQGLYFPEEYSVDPRQMIGRVLAYLQEQWALDYRPYHLAIGIDRIDSGTLQVTSSNGEQLHAKKVLICSGAEFQTLLPHHFPNEEIEVSMLHMLISQPQSRKLIKGNVLSGSSIRRYESFRECPSYSEIKKRENISAELTEMGIHILFKQTETGELIIGDSHHYAHAHDKDDLGFDFDRKIEDVLIREAKKIMIPDTWSLSKVWTGMYPQSRKGDVFEKEVESDIHILTAIGGKGMTASPGYTFDFINKIFSHD